MPDTLAAARTVLADLKTVFADRLSSFLIYAPDRTPQPSLAIVASLSFDDLSACARLTRRWHRVGFSTPVILIEGEFGRSLDAFPIEFGEIIANHRVVFGPDPFAGLRVEPADIRRACEAQIRSLLLHLREDYMEGGAAAPAVRALVDESAPEFRSILRLLAGLDGQPPGTELAPWAALRLGLDEETVRDVLEISSAPARHRIDTLRLYPRYLAAAERLAGRIDEWA